MNKNLMIALISISFAVLIGIYSLLFYLTPTEEVLGDKIFKSSLVEEVFPIMQDYCQNLDSKATSESCPVCTYPELSECDFVETRFQLEIGDDVCFLEMKGKGYLLSSRRNVIYYDGEETEFITFKFTLDKDGNILSQDFPQSLSCL